MNVLGLIPARGGSKGIPEKNISALNGKPLIAWSIREANRSNVLSHTIVSTDSQKIAQVAKDFGADVPFLRPDELSGDEAGAVGVMRHAVNFMQKKENMKVDVLLYLQPTSPFRKAEQIDVAIESLVKYDADVVVSVQEVPHNMLPNSLMQLEGNLLKPISDTSPLDRHQKKQKLYARNGPAILAVKTDYLFENDYLYGGKVVSLLMDHMSSVDIDTVDDLVFAEAISKLYLSA